MRRTALIILTLSILAIRLFSADEITFSGGKSTLNLSEGHEEVVLSDGARVSVDTLVINSDRITLSGTDWRYVNCTGYTVVSDEERGIEIRTRDLWYDRESERLLISSWFEIDDTKEEISAMGGSLLYDMKGEILELSKNITLQKITDDGLMTCQAESIIFDRNNDLLTLRGNASVDWDGDKYSSEAISVDVENDNISLDGRIQGSIYG